MASESCDLFILLCVPWWGNTRVHANTHLCILGVILGLRGTMILDYIFLAPKKCFSKLNYKTCYNFLLEPMLEQPCTICVSGMFTIFDNENVGANSISFCAWLPEVLEQI